MRWYSNESTTWIVLRGLIAALIGALLVYLFDLQSISWAVVFGVPIALVLINLVFRETPGSTKVSDGNKRK